MSVALGNIEIDQAVSSTIADKIAAVKGTLMRMAPTSGHQLARRIEWRFPHKSVRPLETKQPRDCITGAASHLSTKLASLTSSSAGSTPVGSN